MRVGSFFLPDIIQFGRVTSDVVWGTSVTQSVRVGHIASQTFPFPFPVTPGEGDEILAPSIVMEHVVCQGAKMCFFEDASLEKLGLCSPNELWF